MIDQQTLIDNGYREYNIGIWKMSKPHYVTSYLKQFADENGKKFNLEFHQWQIEGKDIFTASAHFLTLQETVDAVGFNDIINETTIQDVEAFYEEKHWDGNYAQWK